jgi:hypothetical protein
VAIVGEGEEYPLPISDGMIRTGFTLHGIWHWNLGDAPDMMRMISRVGKKLDCLITHRFPAGSDRGCVEAADDRPVRQSCDQPLNYFNN